MADQMFNFNSNMSNPNQMFNFATGSGSSGMGGNQYGMMPSLPNMNSQNSGAIPAANASAAPIMPSGGGQPGVGPSGGTGVGTLPLGTGLDARTNPTTTDTNTGQYKVGSTQDPALTHQFFEWLRGKIGQGVSPYPGSLTAPDNPLLMQIMQSLQGGGSMNDMLKTGSPIDQTKAWQAMVQSMQQNTQRGEADLKEQFNVGGGLAGSPFGDAMQNYLSQTTSTENAQLLAAQTQALEQAQGRKLSANEFAGQFGQYMQGLDQASIDRMYQEYIRTSPEYNPLLQNMQTAAGQYPPYLHTKDMMDQFAEIINALKPGYSAGSGASIG